MQLSAVTYSFKDPCWSRPVNTREAADRHAKPFQDGIPRHPAQQGATSSAGLLGNGKAAMELQGHWNPGVRIRPLTPG